MNWRRYRVVGPAGLAVVGMLLASACTQTPSGTASTSAKQTTSGTLTGAQEVPPVNTQASGVSRIEFIGNKVVIGSVKVSNMNATAAHIHRAPMGQNGPVIITLEKSGADTWVVAGNTVLSSEQFDALMSGELYVNVHSAAYPNGEIRAQLKP